MAPEHGGHQHAHGPEKGRVTQVRDPAEHHQRGPWQVRGNGVGERMVGLADHAAVGDVRGNPREQAGREQDQHEARREPERDARLAGLVGVLRVEVALLQHMAGDACAEHRDREQRNEPGQRMHAELLGGKNRERGERGFRRHSGAP
jgi:hypothetical protein